jgi:hypothetical protein
MMSKERVLAKWQSLTYSPKFGCSSESVLCLKFNSNLIRRAAPLVRKENWMKKSQNMLWFGS